MICSVDFKYLNNEPLESTYRMVTTHYFTGENLELTGWNKWLALVPRQFGFAVDHFCLISSVSEKYGNGNSLLSVSVVVKKDVPVSQLKQELNQLAKRDLKLDLVITHTVPKALPRYPESSASFKKIDNVVYCGDRWSSPSINGALRSGRLAAESVLNEIKK